MGKHAYKKKHSKNIFLEHFFIKGPLFSPTILFFRIQFPMFLMIFITLTLGKLMGAAPHTQKVEGSEALEVRFDALPNLDTSETIVVDKYSTMNIHHARHHVEKDYFSFFIRHATIRGDEALVLKVFRTITWSHNPAALVEATYIDSLSVPYAATLLAHKNGTLHQTFLRTKKDPDLIITELNSPKGYEASTITFQDFGTDFSCNTHVHFAQGGTFVQAITFLNISFIAPFFATGGKSISIAWDLDCLSQFTIKTNKQHHTVLLTPTPPLHSLIALQRYTHNDCVNYTRIHNGSTKEVCLEEEATHSTFTIEHIETHTLLSMRVQKTNYWQANVQPIMSCFYQQGDRKTNLTIQGGTTENANGKIIGCTLRVQADNMRSPIKSLFKISPLTEKTSTSSHFSKGVNAPQVQVAIPLPDNTHTVLITSHLDTLETLNVMLKTSKSSDLSVLHQINLEPRTETTPPPPPTSCTFLQKPITARPKETPTPQEESTPPAKRPKKMPPLILIPNKQ